MKKAFVAIAILVTSTFLLFAKSQTVTLHMVATVPEKVSVSLDEENVVVDMNFDDVFFAAYDSDGNLLATTPEFDQSLACDGIWLCFTAK